MRYSLLMLLIAGVLGWSTTAQADFIPLVDGSGNDSGWDISLGGAATGFSVLQITPGQSITISLQKTYGPAVIEDGDVEFPVALVTFRQRLTDIQTAPSILIDHEAIQNNTGLTWSSFRWSIYEPIARMSIAASTAWDVRPFAAMTWENPLGDLASGLLVTGGNVPHQTVFAPNGGLSIVASLAMEQPAIFTFKQTVTPEPASLALLSLAGVTMFGRRRGAHNSRQTKQLR